MSLLIPAVEPGTHPEVSYDDVTDRFVLSFTSIGGTPYEVNLSPSQLCKLEYEARDARLERLDRRPLR